MPRGFADQAGAIAALQKATPDLKCLVCGTSRFECVDFSGDGLRTSIKLEGMPTVPNEFVLTLTLACARCGFIMRFLEPTLAELGDG